MTLETKSAFAARLGFDRSIFSRKKDGIKTLPDWLVLNGGLVEVEESIRRRAAMASSQPHHRAHVQQLEAARADKIESSPPPASSPTETPVSVGAPSENRAEKIKEIEELNLRLKRADANIREHDEEIKRMERELKAGNLLAREDVEFALDDLGATLRGLMENMPDRIAPVIHPLQTLEETHAALSDAAQDILQTMHDQLHLHASKSV